MGDIQILVEWDPEGIRLAIEKAKELAKGK